MPVARYGGTRLASWRSSSHSTAASVSACGDAGCKRRSEAAAALREHCGALQHDDERHAEPRVPRPVARQPRDGVENEERDAGRRQETEAGQQRAGERRRERTAPCGGPQRHRRRAEIAGNRLHAGHEQPGGDRRAPRRQRPRDRRARRASRVPRADARDHAEQQRRDQAPGERAHREHRVLRRHRLGGAQTHRRLRPRVGEARDRQHERHAADPLDGARVAAPFGPRHDAEDQRDEAGDHEQHAGAHAHDLPPVVALALAAHPCLGNVHDATRRRSPRRRRSSRRTATRRRRRRRSPGR